MNAYTQNNRVMFHVHPRQEMGDCFIFSLMMMIIYYSWGNKEKALRQMIEQTFRILKKLALS